MTEALPAELGRTRLAFLYPGIGAEADYDELGAVDLLVSFARERGCTPSQVAVAWLCRQPGVSAALFGSTNSEHIAENAHAGDLEFDEEVLAGITAFAHIS